MIDQYYLIIPASGIGSRMGSNLPKQYLQLDNGLSVLEQTLKTLLSIQQIKKCVVTITKQDRWFQQSTFAQHPKLQTTFGGKQRHHSVINALAALKSDAQPNDWVLVHDAARPCIKIQDVEQMMTQLKDHPVGGLLATPVVDTLKQAKQTLVEKTVDRSNLWHALTPQMYRFGVLSNALHKAVNDGINITDDASGIEYLGLDSVIILGNKNNLKITHPEDLALANFYLKTPTEPLLAKYQ